MPNCTKSSTARGLCPAHYSRYWQYGDPAFLKPRATTCGSCGAQKTADRWNGCLICEPCRAANRARWVEKNAEKLRLDQRERYLRDRDRRIAYMRLRYQANPAAHIAQTVEYARRNRDAVRARRAAWEAALREDPARLNRYQAQKRASVNRRYARKRAAICSHGISCVTAELYEWIRTQVCIYCGAPAEHADHQMPLKRGGLHCKDNLVPACASCNLRKNAMLPEIWEQVRARSS